MYGRNYKVGVGVESTRGTVVSPTFWVPLLDIPSVKNVIEYAENEQSLGVNVDADDAVIVAEHAEGELRGKIQDKSFGVFLKAAIGQVASAVKETTAYNHTFEWLNSNLHPSLTLEIKNDNEQLAHALAVLQSLTITAEAKQYVQYTAAFLTKKGTSASNTPSYTEQNEFFAKHITMKYADNLAGLGSGVAIDVQKVDISFAKNAEAQFKLGDNEPQDIRNGIGSIEGTLEAVFDTTTLKALHEAGTSKALRISMVNGSKTVGATSNPALIIDLPKVKFKGWDPSGGLNERIMQTINFKAYYSLADAKFVKAVLTNEQVSY